MDIQVIRSKRRRKTVSARLIDGRCVVRAPAHLSEAALEPVVKKLVAKLVRKEEGAALDDAVLERLARTFNRRYFDGRLSCTSIRWVTNQRACAGSCTPAHGTIRISHRLAKMPDFVRDYVIVHELAHLLEANHSPAFWTLVNRYPLAERARGYLMAVGIEDVEG